MNSIEATVLSGKVGPLKVHQHGGAASSHVSAALCTVWLQPPQSSKRDRVTAVGCSTCGASVGLATASGAVYIIHVKQRRYVLLDQHSREGTAVCIVPQPSRKLFVGFADGSIRCYDLASHSHIATLSGHGTSLLSIAADARGRLLVTASADKLLLWDAESFQQRRVLADLNFDRVMTAAADNGTLLAVAHASGHLTLVDTTTKQRLVTTRTPACKGQQHLVPSSIAFTPDRQQLLVACRAPPVVLVYQSPSLTLQQVLHVVGPGAGSLLHVQALPDSSSAAVLLSSGQVVCLDLLNAAITLEVLLGNASTDARVNSFDCDTRGNLLVAACSDGQGRLFDLAALRQAAAAAAGGAVSKRAGRAAKATQVAAAVGPGQKSQPLMVEQLSLQQLGALPGYGLTPLTQQTAVASSAGDAEGEGERPALQQLSQNVATGLAAQKAGARAGKAGQTAAAAKAGGQLKAQRVDLPASALNRAKLEQLLKRFGVFPHQQRALIWDGLLRLPHHAAAHAALVDRGVHPAYQQLPALLQGTSGKLVGRLQAVLSQLSHWCPLFGEGGFAPRFCFPFIRVLGANQVTSFEALATLLVNWSQGWFDHWPNPPVQLLRKLLAVLSHHDQQLGAHLTSLQPAVLSLLWQHLSSALSDLLPAAADWGRAWDHILVAGPGFMYQVLMAWLVEVRGLLLAEGDAAGMERVLASQPAVDLGKVLERAYQLQRTTPAYMHLAPKPVSYLPGTPSTTAASTSSSSSSTGAGGAASVGMPVYPLFTDYPAGCVDQQRLEREKVQAAEAALLRRCQVIAELEARSKQVAFESHALTAAREQLVALDAQRREAALGVEEALAAAGAQLGDGAKAERLRQIRLVEDAYQRTLSSLKAQWGPELAALKEETERRRRLMALTLKGLQEEEDIKALEFQAQQRLWALEQDQMAAAAKSSLQDAAAAATAALSAKQRAAAEQWHTEDRARELAARHEAARRAAVVAQAENSAAGQAAAALLMQQELEAAHNLAKVEHARRLRQLAEDEAAVTAAQLELEREEAGLRAAAAAADAKRQAEGMTSWLSEQQRSRLAAIAAEQAALAGRKEALRAEVGQLAAAARLEQPAASSLAALQQLVEGADEVEAAAAAELLRKLRRERRHHQQLQEDMQALRFGGGQLGEAAASGRTAAASPVTSPARRPGSAAAAARSGAGGRALERAAAAAAAAATAVQAAAQARRVAAAAAETAEELASGEEPDQEYLGTSSDTLGWQAGAADQEAAAADRRQQAYQQHLEQEVEGHLAQLRGAAAAAAEVADRLHGRSPPRAAGPSSVTGGSPGSTRGPASGQTPAGSGEGGPGSSYSSLLRDAAAGRAGSVTSGTSDLSAEVEALLAEAEAEVQREDSALREILEAAGLDAQVMGLAPPVGGSLAPVASAPTSSNASSMGRMEGPAMVMRGAMTASGRGAHSAAAGSAKLPTAAPGKGLSAAAGSGGAAMAMTGVVVSTAPPRSTRPKVTSIKQTGAGRPWAVPAAIAAGGGLQPVPEEASDRSKSTPGSRHRASPVSRAASSSTAGSARRQLVQQQQRAASPASFHTASSTSAASSGSKAGRYAPSSPAASSAGSTPVKPNRKQPVGSLAGRQPGPAAAATASAVRGRVGSTATVAAGSKRLLPGGMTLGHGVVGAPGSSQLSSPAKLSGTAGSSPLGLSPGSSISSSRGGSREGGVGGAGRSVYQPVLLGTSTVAAGASSKGYSSSQSAAAATTATLSQLSADLSAAVAAATAAAATAAQRLGSSSGAVAGPSGAGARGAAGGQPGWGHNMNSLGSSHSSGEPTLSVLSGAGESAGAPTTTSPDLWPLSSLGQGSNPGGGMGFLHNPLLAPPGGDSSQQQYISGSRAGSTTSSGTSVSSLGLYLRKGSAVAAAAAASLGAAAAAGGVGSGTYGSSLPGAGASSSAEGLGAGGSGPRGLAGVSVDSSAEVGGFRFPPSQASSTATSQELDSLLRQLSGAEQRLMAGAGRVASLAAPGRGGVGGAGSSLLGSSQAGVTASGAGADSAGAGGGAGYAGGAGWSSLDLGSSVTSGSLSWSQTLKVVEEAAGLTKG